MDDHPAYITVYPSGNEEEAHQLHPSAAKRSMVIKALLDRPLEGPVDIPVKLSSKYLALVVEWLNAQFTLDSQEPEIREDDPKRMETPEWKSLLDVDHIMLYSAANLLDIPLLQARMKMPVRSMFNQLTPEIIRSKLIFTGKPLFSPETQMAPKVE